MSSNIPSSLQEIAHIVITFRHQLKRFFDYLLLHILVLKTITIKHMAEFIYEIFDLGTNLILHKTQDLIWKWNTNKGGRGNKEMHPFSDNTHEILIKLRQSWFAMIVEDQYRFDHVVWKVNTQGFRSIRTHEAGQLRWYVSHSVVDWQMAVVRAAYTASNKSIFQ